MHIMYKPELLAPAGNMEKLRAAVIYGADVVYLGGPDFGLRAHAGNFTLAELRQAVSYAHAHNVKVYLTLNIFARNSDIERVKVYLREVGSTGIDALIISDLGLLRLSRELVPRLPVHISTQANTTNWLSCREWEKLGASRIILSRELTLAEIKEIKAKTGISLEVFIHGAMCLAYSGRCFLSAYMTGRSANRGDCAHPCRYSYRLVEEKRPGEYYPVEEDIRGAYILSPADLCMLEHIPEFIQAGIDAFKIEGRMKSLHYTATVVKAYRRAIDACLASRQEFEAILPDLAAEIAKTGTRSFTTGFYFGDNIPVSWAGDGEETEFAGVVLAYDEEKKLALVEQRNKFSRGDFLEIMAPRSENLYWQVTAIYNVEGEAVNSAPHPGEQLFLPIPFKIEPWSILRKRKI